MQTATAYHGSMAGEASTAPVTMKRFGIVGGLGARAGADLFSKLARFMPAGSRDNFDVILEQHPFPEGPEAGTADYNHTARKLYVFQGIKGFEGRKVDAVLLPCFISHTFLEELRDEVALPVLNLMEALVAHVGKSFPGLRRLGVLTSDYVRMQKLFERYFEHRGYSLVYPDPEVQRESLMPAIYGPCGVKAGFVDHGPTLLQLYDSGRNLVARGAEIILPGFTELALVVDRLAAMELQVVDPNLVYARHATEVTGAAAVKPFKIGIVGGVGPAATVDFMSKIVRSTPATRDQEHLKMVVENNPQIPDRTENLLGRGADPTVALYSTCKKLEANDASLIAIPCNTAHAFVERIQPHLEIPIVHMLFETREHLRRHFPQRRRVGLLATSGTIESRVYHDAFAGTGIELLVPEPAYQDKVMGAIYGKHGVKAGCTEGACRSDLLEALHHLVGRGADAIILGCTELPLILSENSDYQVLGRSVAVLDPTEILARRCAAIGTEWRDHAARREWDPEQPFRGI